MAAAASSSDITTNDRPVLNLINKRLRALRKKLNRISQMEESRSNGKILNKEQSETLRSKSSVIAAIDELEKLRQPLSQAVDEEIQLALERKIDPNPEPESKDEENNSFVSDLLGLLYFAIIFDVQSLMRVQENMLTRMHERNCCLTYDYVTDDDDAADFLKEWDLDLIAGMGSSLVSRPVNSIFSHKDALRECVERAKLWIANSQQPIEPNSSVTYAGLKEKLKKIMASDYFTTTPEIKAPDELAAAVGSYTDFQVPVHGSLIPPFGGTVPVESSTAEYDNEEEESPEEESPNSHDN